MFCLYVKYFCLNHYIRSENGLSKRINWWQFLVVVTDCCCCCSDDWLRVVKSRSRNWKISIWFFVLGVTQNQERRAGEPWVKCGPRGPRPETWVPLPATVGTRYVLYLVLNLEGRGVQFNVEWWFIIILSWQGLGWSWLGNGQYVHTSLTRTPKPQTIKNFERIIFYRKSWLEIRD